MGTRERSDWLGDQRPLAVQPCAAVRGVRRVLLYRPKVCPMLVGDHFVRDDATPFDRLLEKGLGAL